MDNIILRCDNNINGIFTAIYDAFVYKNQMQKENEILSTEEISLLTKLQKKLFSQLKMVAAIQ